MKKQSILKTCKEIYEYNSKYKTNYDILVINDCSTDSTLKICKMIYQLFHWFII